MHCCTSDLMLGFLKNDAKLKIYFSLGPSNNAVLFFLIGIPVMEGSSMNRPVYQKKTIVVEY